MQYIVYIHEIAATNNIDNMKGIKENRRNEKSIVSGESNLVYLVDVWSHSILARTMHVSMCAYAYACISVLVDNDIWFVC